MSFVHECNENNRNDIKGDEFAWHKCLFVNVNEMAETYEYF